MHPSGQYTRGVSVYAVAMAEDGWDLLITRCNQYTHGIYISYVIKIMKSDRMQMTRFAFSGNYRLNLIGDAWVNMLTGVIGSSVPLARLPPPPQCHIVQAIRPYVCPYDYYIG